MLGLVSRRWLSSPAKATKVGIIGLGNVGGAMSRNLLRKGYALSAVHDLDAERMGRLVEEGGGRVAACGTPKEVGQRSEVVLTVLPTPAHVRDALEGPQGLIAGLAKGSVWVDHSTTDHEQTLRLAAAVEAAGAEALEAPVTGGMALLHQGKMTALCGGPEPVFRRCEEILSQSCEHVLHLGPIGSATVTKIISNMMAGAHLLVAGEALTLARRSDVDLKAFFDAIRLSAGNSYVFETEAPLMFKGTFDPEFTIHLHCKDLNLGYEMARKSGTPLPLHSLVEALYRSAMARYGPDVGSSAPARLNEDLTGTSLKTPGFDDWTYSFETVKGGSIGVVQTTKTELAGKTKQ